MRPLHQLVIGAHLEAEVLLRRLQGLRERELRKGIAAWYEGKTPEALRSVDAHLGPDFRRVRIGIGHPGPGRKDLVTPHVLGNYAKSEMEALSDMLGAIAAEAAWLADGDDARFMSEVALRLQQES